MFKKIFEIFFAKFKEILNSIAFNGRQISFITMKITTNTGKNQKFVRKVREKRVEVIQTVDFSLKALLEIRLRSANNKKCNWKIIYVNSKQSLALQSNH